MITVEDARNWITEQWGKDAFCSVSFKSHSSKTYLVKGAFTLERALEIINLEPCLDSYIDDMIVSVPDENTSWFTRLDTKDIDGNKLKLCHRCLSRFSSESCPEH